MSEKLFNFEYSDIYEYDVSMYYGEDLTSAEHVIISVVMQTLFYCVTGTPST